MSEIILSEVASVTQPSSGFVSIYPDATADPQIMIRDDTAAAIALLDTRNTATATNKTFTSPILGGAVQLTGTTPAISKYNNIATAGAGVPFIVASAATASVAATQTNLINYTPPATAGRYRLSYTIANTAGTNTGSTTPLFTYKDAAGIAKSYNIPMAQEGSVTWLLAATAASKNFSGSFYFSIDNSATAITATFTIAGTVATFISVTLEQLA